MEETPTKRPITRLKVEKFELDDNEMEISCTENDFLVLKEIKFEHNALDCLDESPYLKSIRPTSTTNATNRVLKLSRKRANCETISPKRNLSSNLFNNKFSALPSSPIVHPSKKWRSASYNNNNNNNNNNSNTCTSPMKMELASPLKPIDANIITSNSNTMNTTSKVNTAANLLTTGNITSENNTTSTNSAVTIVNKTIDNLMNSVNHKHDFRSANLLGDYSNTYALPLISGRHKDLKTISPETLANLMNGDYGKSIESFTIVDARYPYEYAGGHIDGSLNIYDKQEINKYFFGTDKPTLATDRNLIQDTIVRNAKNSSLNLITNRTKRLSVIREAVVSNCTNDENVSNASSSDLVSSVANDDSCKIKRHAIIFHCEFSSERGPGMCRFLRKIDRELNEHCYPNLFYPEIYLLHGGYKLFFEKFKNLCFPQTYLPMHSSDHRQDLIKFRVKSKSWNCERGKWRTSARN